MRRASACRTRPERRQLLAGQRRRRQQQPEGTRSRNALEVAAARPAGLWGQLLPSHRSRILGCHLLPNFMTGDRRETKRMKNFEYLEEFKAGDILCSDHVMEEGQLLSIKKALTCMDARIIDFGILPPKEEVKDEIEEMVLHLQKEAEVKPYEKMNLKQLKEAEDDFDEEDLKAVEMYRKQRLAELKALQKRQRFGELNEISGNQYVKEVTNAPKDVIPTCALVNRHLSLLAIKFPETKFVKAIAKSCIENYHDNCLPTIFIYKNGKIEGKLIGVVEFGGTALTVEDLEWKLAEFGAIKTDLEENPRKGIKDMMMSSLRKASTDDN
ncbi:hypothetical protein E2320_007992 [Naja naja]|nr:hypothetical protein E2320_007992 [Naja naja]